MEQARSTAPRPFYAGRKRPQEEIPRRTKISSACLACKRRRSKCGGGTPCGSCLKNKTEDECIYDQDNDKRRRILLHQRQKELQEDRDLLIRLVRTLREVDNRRVFQLINLIRSNASLNEIKQYINDHLYAELEQTPELLDVTTRSDQARGPKHRSRRRIMDVRRLADVPRWKVPARPWTRLTDDDEFVSHLVSLWLTWSYPSFNCIDSELFVRDMQLWHPEKAKYCSPFLVNVILADACTYSDYPEAFADEDDPSSKGQHFYEEAKRLYEAEEGRVTLTTMQGLGVLWACAGLMGKDRLGWIFQGQLAYTVQDFVALVDGGKASEYEPRAVNNTVWGLYNIITTSSMLEQKLPLVKLPQRPYVAPPPVEIERSDKWYPYPVVSEDGVPSYTVRMLNSMADLNRIVHNFSAMFFGGKDKFKDMAFPQTLSTVEELHARLQEWNKNLVNCLRVENNDTPHALSLHMYYSTITMTIFGFVEAKAKEEAVPRDKYQHVQDLRLQSARRVAKLMSIHRASWGIHRAPASNIQWTTAAQNTLLEHLDDRDNHEAFVSLCIAARAFARRWVLAKARLRSIQMTAQWLGIALPVETHVLFSETETKWASKDSKSFRSLSPNFGDVGPSNLSP